MSWAGRRRFIIALIVGSIIVAFLAVVLVSVIYQTPTCTDGIQNQDETGIDCGGSCARVCLAQAQPPTVLYAKALPNVNGYTDVIAAVENKNPAAAAKNVPYRLTIYGSGQILLQQVSGTVDLPPGTTVPVFIPGVVTGKQTVVNTFLEIASTSPQWYALPTDPRILPAVSNPRPVSSFRIEATLANSRVTKLSNVPAIVIVYDEQKEIIAATQTLVPEILPQGQATAIFVWNSPFPRTPATIEVIPIVPLP